MPVGAASRGRGVHGAADVRVTIELPGSQQRFDFCAGGGHMFRFFFACRREYSGAAERDQEGPAIRVNVEEIDC